MALPAWRRNQIAITVAACLVFAGFTLVLPFLPYYVEMVGVRGRAVDIWAGVLLSTAPFLAALMAPVWGRLADRYGMKIMVQRTTLAMIVHWTLMAFARNVGHLLALRIFLGIFSGFTAMSVALVAHGAPKEKLGRIVGTLQAAQILAAAAGPFIGGVLYESIGLRGACLVTALFCLGGFGLITLAYDDSDVAARNPIVGPVAGAAAGAASGADIHADDGADELTGATAGPYAAPIEEPGTEAPPPMAPPAPALRGGKDRMPLLEIARLPGFASIGAVLFFATVISRSFSLVTPLMVRALITGPGAVGLLAGVAVSGAAFAEALSSIIQGRISARVSPRILTFIGLTLASVAVLPMILASGVLSFTLLRVLQGLVAGGTLTLGYTLAGSIIPERARATGYGLLSSTAMLGGAFGPVLAGLVSYTCGMRWVFALTSIGYAALALVALRGIRCDIETSARDGAPPPRPYLPVPR